MKKNDLTEIKSFDTKTLIEKAKNIKKEIADLIMDKNMSKLKDLKVIGKKRKDLAQTLTILKQKQLLEALESRVKSQVKTVEVVDDKETIEKKGKVKW